MKFDPTGCVEEADFDPMEAVLEEADAKAKAVRTQIIADAIKDLVKASKEDAANLHESLTKTVTDIVDKLSTNLSAHTATLTSSLAEHQKRHEAMMERMKALEDRSKDRHTSLVSRLDNLRGKDEEAPAAPAPASPEPALLSAIQAKLEAMHTSMAAKAPEPVKAPEAPKPRRFRFKVNRDDYGRMKDIEACEE